jgi:bifunctional non-homologous end joining protein LigD
MSEIAITHPEKVMFPDDGITKGELAAYYELVAPAMLLHMKGRPVTLERFHRGIGEKGFFQKNVVRGAPAWLERVAVPKKDGVVNYPVVRDTRGIMWLTNQNCITPHVWTSRVPDLFHPDLCIFDLDPLEENADAMRSATLLLRDTLAELGVTGWVKTSGSKGFHVAFALDEKSDSGQVAHFAHSLGRELVRRAPDLLTREFYKADRGGKILIDTARNEFGATYAAAYAVRPKTRAPVSAPCTWEEVESGEAGPRTFTLRTMAERLDARGDLWANIFQSRASLPTAP